MTEAQLAEFFKPIEVETRTPVIDKEQLRAGVLVRYHGAKEVKTRGKFGDSNTLHTFSTIDGGDDRAFAVWGTGALNQQLAKVAKGGIVFLAYSGKLADKIGVESHRWAVNLATRPLAQLPSELREGLAPNARALVTAIAAAEIEEARKFAERAARGDQILQDDAGYYAALERDG